jgi:hypothetical protein
MATVTTEQTRAIEALLAEVATRDSVAFCQLYRPKCVHPERGLTQFVPWDYQQRVLRTLDAGLPIIVNKSRQTGISTTVMIQKLCRCLIPGRTVPLVSSREKVAGELIRIAQIACDGCDPPFPVAQVKGSSTLIEFENGSRMIALASSPDTGRTYASSDLVIDEFEAMPWQREMWQGIAPTASRSGAIAVISTPRLEGGEFHGMCLQAQAGIDRWAYFELPWQVCPEYNEAWAERTRRELRLTEQEWGEEFECRFGSTQDAVFRAEFVTAAIERGRTLPPGKGVALGADVAGEGRDQTVLMHLTETDGLYRPEVFGSWDVLPAPVLQQYMQEAQQQFGVPLWIDQTGIGWGIRQNLTCPSTGVVFTGGQTETVDHGTATWHVARTKLVSNAVLLFEQGAVAIPPGQEPLVLGLRSYSWAKRAGMNADYVDALLLTLWAATMGQTGANTIEVW